MLQIIKTILLGPCFTVSFCKVYEESYQLQVVIQVYFLCFFAQPAREVVQLINEEKGVS